MAAMTDSKKTKEISFLRFSATTDHQSVVEGI
jgi:hypothetical protein